MTAGPYEWKLPLSTQEVHVWFSDTALTLNRKGVAQSVAYDEIESVYVNVNEQRMFSVGPAQRAITLNIVARNGEQIDFGTLTFGNSRSYRECRQAVLVLLNHLERTNSKATLFVGPRMTPRSRWSLIGGLVFFTTLFALKSLYENPDQNLGMLLAVWSVCVIVVTAVFLFLLRQSDDHQTMTLAEAREALPASDGDRSPQRAS